MESTVTNIPTPTPPKKKSFKVIIIIFLLILLVGLCAIVGVVLLGIYSFNNDKQIPIISDVTYALYKSTGHPKTVSDSYKTEAKNFYTGLLTPFFQKKGFDLDKFNIDPKNKIENLKFDLKIKSITIPTIDPAFNIEDLKIAMRGAFDQSNINNVKLNTTFNIDTTVSGLSLNIPGEVTYIDNNLYVKFNNIPSLLGMYINILKVENKWIKIDEATLGELGNSRNSSSKNDPLTEKDFKNWQSFQERMDELLLAKETTKLPSEKIKGNDSFCINQINDAELIYKKVQFGEYLFRETKDFPIPNIGKNAKSDTKICINKKTSRIHAVKSSVTDTPDYDQDWDLKLWDYNQANDITAPDSYMNIKDFERLGVFLEQGQGTGSSPF